MTKAFFVFRIDIFLKVIKWNKSISFHSVIPKYHSLLVALLNFCMSARSGL
jgi:hypothetical protein